MNVLFEHQQIPKHIAEPIQNYIATQYHIEKVNGIYPFSISIEKDENKSDCIVTHGTYTPISVLIGDITSVFKESRKTLSLGDEMYRIQSAIAFLTHLHKLQGYSREEITRRTDVYIGKLYCLEGDKEE